MAARAMESGEPARAIARASGDEWWRSDLRCAWPVEQWQRVWWKAVRARAQVVHEAREGRRRRRKEERRKRKKEKEEKKIKNRKQIIEHSKKYRNNLEFNLELAEQVRNQEIVRTHILRSKHAY